MLLFFVSAVISILSSSDEISCSQQMFENSLCAEPALQNLLVSQSLVPPRQNADVNDSLTGDSPRFHRGEEKQGLDKKRSFHQFLSSIFPTHWKPNVGENNLNKKPPFLSRIVQLNLHKFGKTFDDLSSVQLIKSLKSRDTKRKLEEVSSDQNSFKHKIAFHSGQKSPKHSSRASLHEWHSSKKNETFGGILIKPEGSKERRKNSFINKVSRVKNETFLLLNRALNRKRNKRNSGNGKLNDDHLRKRGYYSMGGAQRYLEVINGRNLQNSRLEFQSPGVQNIFLLQNLGLKFAEAPNDSARVLRHVWNPGHELRKTAGKVQFRENRGIKFDSRRKSEMNENEREISSKEIPRLQRRHSLSWKIRSLSDQRNLLYSERENITRENVKNFSVRHLTIPTREDAIKRLREARVDRNSNGGKISKEDVRLKFPKAQPNSVGNIISIIDLVEVPVYYDEEYLNYDESYRSLVEQTMKNGNNRNSVPKFETSQHTSEMNVKPRTAAEVVERLYSNSEQPNSFDTQIFAPSSAPLNAKNNLSEAAESIGYPGGSLTDHDAKSTGGQNVNVLVNSFDNRGTLINYTIYNRNTDENNIQGKDSISSFVQFFLGVRKEPGSENIPNLDEITAALTRPSLPYRHETGNFIQESSFAIDKRLNSPRPREPLQPPDVDETFTVMNAPFIFWENSTDKVKTGKFIDSTNPLGALHNLKLENIHGNQNKTQHLEVASHPILNVVSVSHPSTWHSETFATPDNGSYDHGNKLEILNKAEFTDPHDLERTSMFEIIDASDKNTSSNPSLRTAGTGQFSLDILGNSTPNFEEYSRASDTHKFIPSEEYVHGLPTATGLMSAFLQEPSEKFTPSSSQDASAVEVLTSKTGWENAASTSSKILNSLQLPHGMHIGYHKLVSSVENFPPINQGLIGSFWENFTSPHEVVGSSWNHVARSPGLYEDNDYRQVVREPRTSFSRFLMPKWNSTPIDEGRHNFSSKIRVWAKPYSQSYPEPNTYSTTAFSGKSIPQANDGSKMQEFEVPHVSLSTEQEQLHLLSKANASNLTVSFEERLPYDGRRNGSESSSERPIPELSSNSRNIANIFTKIARSAAAEVAAMAKASHPSKD